MVIIQAMKLRNFLYELKKDRACFTARIYALQVTTQQIVVRILETKQ